MNAERWRPVVGYEGRYEVSDLGNVRSIRFREPRARRPFRDPKGYLRVQLHNDYRVKTTFVHRLVLLAFRGACPDGMQGCHNDGDKDNNRLDNLRWDTPSANTLDQVAHGVHNMASKVACVAGHPLEGANIYWADGGRHCRICKRVAKRRATLRVSPVIPEVSLTHAQLREWAKRNDVACPIRGAVPRAVVQRFLDGAA